jgi:thioesterase domain-containing protein
VLDYADLARSLGPDQPVHGLQGRGLDGLQPPDDRIETMAAYALEGLRAAQPEGPYCLAGYCFGGIVAFEMAQQLQARGQQVALLAILDIPPPNSEFRRLAWRPGAVPHFLRNLPRWLGSLGEPGPTGTMDRVVALVRTTRRPIFRLRPGAPRRFDVATAFHMPSEIPDSGRRTLEIHHQALMSYAPRSYPGRVTLFRAHTQPLRWSFNPDPFLGWREFAAGGVQVREAPGFHANMHLEPHARVLARELRACLDEALEPGPEHATARVA